MPLKKALDEVANTLLFAPDHNWSASGHPKTLHKPLRAERATLADGSVGYVSSAPPPDCVALALLGLSEQRPDLVASGINIGPNLGYDIYYSGTVAAAVEAVIHGLPAIAISRDMPAAQEDFSGPAVFSAKLARLVLGHGLPADTLLNVNFPADAWSEVEGVYITRLGRRVYRDELDRRQDPAGRSYYWIGGERPEGQAEHGTDIWAMQNKLISITPIHLDLTAHRFREELHRWHLEDFLTSN
jgi:5'-nucleotidase